MKKRNYTYGACHFCVCTACSRFKCPFKHLTYSECYICREHGENRPRLDCDYFSHYLKTVHFRFRPAPLRVPKHFGTYILITSSAVFVGKYDKLIKLASRFGGEPKKLDIIDYNFGGTKNE